MLPRAPEASRGAEGRLGRGTHLVEGGEVMDRRPRATWLIL